MIIRSEFTDSETGALALCVDAILTESRSFVTGVKVRVPGSQFRARIPAELRQIARSLRSHAESWTSYGHPLAWGGCSALRVSEDYVVTLDTGGEEWSPRTPGSLRLAAEELEERARAWSAQLRRRKAAA